MQDDLAGMVERLLKQRGLEMRDPMDVSIAAMLTALSAERDQARADLAEAVGRIRDMLDGDDGQAYSEARSFITKHKETHQQ